jgi:hypothetical protein
VSSLIRIRRNLDTLRTGVELARERNLHGARNEIGQFVHGVRTQHYEVRSAPFELPRRIGQDATELVPLAGMLQTFHFGKIHRDQNAGCVVLAAKAALGFLVDQAIVFRRRFPAHPAD